MLAAWREVSGCGITVLSNWILTREDQVGCGVFRPIDAAEARHAPRDRGQPAAVHQ